MPPIGNSVPSRRASQAFDYAPFSQTRGPEADRVNKTDLQRAEPTLLDALHNKPTPAVHHALGEVYLAKKQFDDAIKEFEEALKTDPKNAQLYSDLGAAWLEKGRIDSGSSEGGKGIEEFARGLDNLNKALELNPRLLEALFNRALSVANSSVRKHKPRMIGKLIWSLIRLPTGRMKLVGTRKGSAPRAALPLTKAQLLEQFRQAYRALAKTTGPGLDQYEQRRSVRHKYLSATVGCLSERRKKVIDRGRRR